MRHVQCRGREGERPCLSDGSSYWGQQMNQLLWVDVLKKSKRQWVKKTFIASPGRFTDRVCEEYGFINTTLFDAVWASKFFSILFVQSVILKYFVSQSLLCSKISLDLSLSCFVVIFFHLFHDGSFAFTIVKWCHLLLSTRHSSHNTPSYDSILHGSVVWWLT